MEKTKKILAVETTSLTKQYKDKAAVKQLNLKVQEGEIYGFIGRNGAGKSTTLKMISGLITPTEGEIKLFGKPINDPIIRRRIGVLIESTGFYPNLTAKQNMIMKAKLMGLTDYSSVEHVLQITGLINIEKKQIKHFSMGMKQRLGIALALLGNPDLLILDEPINGLDPQGIIEMRQLLLNLNQQYGITILVSSHILDELSRLATHYGFIDNGKMIKEISASDLENSFRKSVRIEVTDGKALAAVLEQTGQPYKILAPNVIEVYNRVNISHLTADLEKYQCDVLSIQEREENLENYYVNLIGGISHE